MFEFTTKDGHVKVGKISVGYYETVTDIVKAMTHHFRNQIYMHYNKTTLKVKATLTPHTRLKLSAALAEIFGFEPTKFTAPNSDLNVTGNLVADLNSPFSLLYVYSDIVDPQLVGDIHAPLLRVKVTGHAGDMVSSLYDPPHYSPLSRKNFQTVVTDVSPTRHLIPFERGETIVEPHFRLKQL